MSLDEHRGGSLGSYEIRIKGLLGPLLLDALPHAAASLEPRHTLVVTRRGDGADLLDVLKVLVDTGAEVESVREVSSIDVPSDPS